MNAIAKLALRAKALDWEGKEGVYATELKVFDPFYRFRTGGLLLVVSLGSNIQLWCMTFSLSLPKTLE